MRGLLLAAVAASVLHVAAGSSCYHTTAEFAQDGICQGAATINLATCTIDESMWADESKLAQYVSGIEGDVAQADCDNTAAIACG